MLFQTLPFLVLFLACVAAFYAFPTRRKAVIALASLAFYAASGLIDLAVLVVTVLVSYWFALRIARTGSGRALAVACVLLIASLAYFQYAAFLYESAASMLGFSLAPERPAFIATLLPLGISFFTFQAIAYLVDLRRGTAPPPRSLLDYWTFIAFFPQLIAGPIMRGKDFLAQLGLLHGATAEMVRTGCVLVLLGLVKKVAIADSLAVYVDYFYGLDVHTQARAWLAGALFGFQIWLDFSGYVDIALGLALILGIRLHENFLSPYVSSNPSEFWRRWHVTLSAWFKDYLYIPLGGSRVRRWRAVLNLMLVMAVAGLWHGAAWTFVIWGVIHGALLVAYHELARLGLADRLRLTNPWVKRALKVGGVALTFNLVMVAWVPFRAPDWDSTLSLFTALVAVPDLGAWLAEAKWLAVVVALYGLHVGEYLLRYSDRRTSLARAFAPAYVRGAAYAAAVLAVVAFVGNQQGFIYFRF